MIKNYLTIAWRNLFKNKVYSFINVAGLALGMTCAIVIFTLVKYHLSFDIFHKDADRIYRIVTEKHRDDITYDVGVPNPLGEAFRNDYPFGEKVARAFYQRNQLVAIQNQNGNKKFQELEGVAFIENGFLDIFNFPLIEGDKNSILNEPNSVIITQKLAKKYFGTENSIGQLIKIDNRLDLKITGILKDIPQNTDLRTEIYVSFQTIKSFNEKVAGNLESWAGITSNMQCYTKLQPHILPKQVENILFSYVGIHRAGNKNVHHYKLQPLDDIHFNPNYSGVIEKNTLWVLSIIGLFLIITVCVNFINLATAQALNRSKEVGMRKVLGSLRRQIIGQFIVETGVITSISTVLGVISARLILPSVNQLFDTHIDTNLFSDSLLVLFIPILIVVITLISGFYPALVLSGFQPIAVLKSKMAQRNIGGLNTRRSLIVMQFAISQVLIIGMIVIVNQMRYAKETDLGFNKEAIVMIPVGSHGSKDVKSKTLKTEIQQIAGVEMVSACYAAPSASYSNGTSVLFESRTEAETFRFVGKPGDSDYLKIFDLKLRAGRNLFPSDSVNEFLVNEMFVQRMNLKSAEEVIGKMITVNDVKAPIVGVVKDFHDKSFYEDIHPVFIANLKSDFTNYAVKINLSNSKNTISAIEKAWSTMYPEQIFSYQFLEEQIARFYATEELLLQLVQIFSLIAIFISCLGLYGLMTFMALQKTKEIGIRKVLGSSIWQIVWLFGKEFSKLIVIAFLIATPISWYFMNNWLQDFKFRINIGVSIFLLSIASTVLITFLTVGYQAIKAALMNPVKSLRME